MQHTVGCLILGKVKREVKNNHFIDCKTIANETSTIYKRGQKTINYNNFFKILRKFVIHFTKYKNQCWLHPLLCFLTFVQLKKNRLHAVTMSLNYGGDCVSVIFSDSVHLLCFSNEKLCCTQKIKQQKKNKGPFL